MRKYLVCVLLLSNIVHAAPDRDIFSAGILVSKSLSDSIKRTQSYRNYLLEEYKKQPELHPYSQVVMLNDILKNSTLSKDCEATESQFKLAYYDYHDKQSFPQKDVTQMAQIFRHVCELKKKESR